MGQCLRTTYSLQPIKMRVYDKTSKIATANESNVSACACRAPCVALLLSPAHAIGSNVCQCMFLCICVYVQSEKEQKITSE